MRVREVHLEVFTVPEANLNPETGEKLTPRTNKTRKEWWFNPETGKREIREVDGAARFLWASADMVMDVPGLAGAGKRRSTCSPPGRLTVPCSSLVAKKHSKKRCFAPANE
jgi:hypothetical protein